MKRYLVRYIGSLLLVLFSIESRAAVDGTMGTPLGGIGAGGIRFCGHQGAFYAADSAPCSMGDFRLLPHSCFRLFTNRNGAIRTSEQLKAVITDNRADDDAAYPLYTANLGSLDDVNVKLLAFSPICFDSTDLMCFPYGFFEITLTNAAQTPAEVSIAMQLGASTAFFLEKAKGIRTSGAVERAIYAACPSDTLAVVSAGGGGGFSVNGQFSGTMDDTIAGAAVKLSLPVQGTKTVRFVYAWYTTTAPDRYYYSNFLKNAGEAATVGLAQFTRLRDNAVQIATRMRASNFPDWIKDHTLNSLCNLTTNGIFTKDGRHCYTEGMWTTNGTMDQMWHARLATIMTVPDLAWKELEWWARTQKSVPEGQIHHDMGNPMPQLWGWDDRQHPEYAYQPDCNPWVDLNCAFIISVYEAYCATGNKTKLDYFWPYVKKAGKRILDQVRQYGDTTVYPYTFTSSLNSYDQSGIDPNPFNAGMTTPAYKILAIISDVYKDTALKTAYQNAFDTVKISFRKKYLSNNFTAGRFSEALLAGQWIGFFLKFGQYYPQADINYALNAMEGYYQPLTNGIGFPAGSYNEWAPYLISHFGGLCLQTGRFDQWRALQHDWYERNYLDRNLVFNQQLGIPLKVTSPTYFATNPSVYNQYISVPVLWRNYYTMLGYHRSKPTGELWLEPVIPPEMNHSIINGFYLSPEGNGTISALETGDKFVDREITFKPDKPIQVSSLYLRDRPSEDVSVTINDSKKTATRIGEGYTMELKIDFSGTIDSSGIVVKVTYKNAGIGRGNTSTSGGRLPRLMTFKNISGSMVLPLSYCGKRISVSLFTPAGELVARRNLAKTVIDVRKDFGVSRGLYIFRLKPIP